MPDLPRVLLWTDTPKAFQDAIAASGVGARVQVETLTRGEIPTQARRADVQAMLAWGAPPGVLPSMARLRWVQAPTAGVETWLAMPDLPAQLTLTCARGTHATAMPENILGALFHVAKPYAGIAADQAHSKWTRRVCTPLNGATLGILGLGAIGQEVARMASAIGMRVIGTRRSSAPLPGLADVLAPERTDEVLAQSDYVLLLLPATPATDNFINAERLARMKSSAWLLNFGRGHLIVDADLIAAVKAKRIAGAILDVFRQEPLPLEHPFWTTPGISVLPHIGGMHPQRDTIVARLFVDNLTRFLDDKPLLHVVDRTAGY
ncbi:MAG: D-2-hydroxyacid dehydrogenase [Acetobacteraceae bacterium]|nr:D-2-hydroxyacid dehydrogenase [Acetobacteraceae bacterium]